MFTSRYPSLRVAYIDEVEEPSKDRSKKVNQKVYYSALVKAAMPKSNSSEPGQNLDQVKIYLLMFPNNLRDAYMAQYLMICGSDRLFRFQLLSMKHNKDNLDSDGLVSGSL